MSDKYYRETEEEIRVLQSLVEKETPKKPFDESLADKLCPTCRAYINFDALNDSMENAPNYCPNCGQHINWEEE